MGIGFLLVKMRLSGSKLTWNEDIPGGKLTAEQAKTFDFGATLSYKRRCHRQPERRQVPLQRLHQQVAHLLQHHHAATEPGSYVVTVCIIGGNHMAAPITRSFQITK